MVGRREEEKDVPIFHFIQYLILISFQGTLSFGQSSAKMFCFVTSESLKYL